MRVCITARPPARPLADVIDDARLTACGYCLRPAGLPCVTNPATGARGVHVGRAAAAWRCGLITGTDLVVVLAMPAVFTTGTLVWTDGAR